jgi:hypothetical protein
MDCKNRKTSTKVEVSLINSNLTITLQLSIFQARLSCFFDGTNVVSNFCLKVIEMLTKKTFYIIKLIDSLNHECFNLKD